MSIREMRIGDTIIGNDMASTYTVVAKSFDSIKARSTDPPHRQKSFSPDELFCVDLDDGLWQQLEEIR